MSSSTALNRTGVAMMTNKSGGDLPFGTVIVFDNTNANGFTTTTTAGLSTRGIGVIVDVAGIANNAIGRVAVGIWVEQINLDAAATIGQFLRTSTVAGQATPHSAPQQEGDFAVTMGSGTSPAAVLFGHANGPSGSISDGDKGDVSVTGGGAVWTIDNDTVTNAKLADMAALTAKVRAANSTGDPSDLALTDGQAAKRVGTAIVSARFGLVSIAVLTTATAATYTVPAGVYALEVIIVGPGGGGGGADSFGTATGGGSGAWAIKSYAVTPGQTFTYTVPAGGLGGVAGNNAGTDGDDTLWDEGGSVVTAPGGLGGGSQAGGSTFASVGLGGGGATPTGGDVNFDGNRASRGWRFSGTTFIGSKGADGPFGEGGDMGGAAGADGDDGNGYGAGGGGATAAGGTDRAGGDGAPGVIYVKEYA